MSYVTVATELYPSAVAAASFMHILQLEAVPRQSKQLDNEGKHISSCVVLMIGS